jgi:hypothetical protein
MQESAGQIGGQIVVKLPLLLFSHEQLSNKLGSTTKFLELMWEAPFSTFLGNVFSSCGKPRILSQCKALPLDITAHSLSRWMERGHKGTVNLKARGPSKLRVACKGHPQRSLWAF